MTTPVSLRPAADIAIVGGGLAAVRTAQRLRDLGFDGSIAMLCGERSLPYDLPPLSKQFLLGAASEDDVLLLEPRAYEELAIDVALGARAVALEPARRRVVLDDGTALAYGRLVVATGARPRELPQLAGYGNVVYLRTLDAARRLRDALAARPRVGIVGGGFIGLEVAAVATELGCEVTVVEGAAAPLAAVLGSEVGGWVRDWHAERGVRFLCGSTVERAHGDGEVRELELADGSRVGVDVVVVGVGVAPDVEWLRGSGLRLHHGLACDERGRTSDPLVFGAGDATCRHVADRCAGGGGHWTGASEQAQAVAATIVGADPPPRPAREGYFWSDQHDTRLQFAGAATPGARVTVVHGAVEERSFVAVYGDPDRYSAVFAMGCAREFLRASMALRRERLSEAVR